jgi:hypothetical protein
MLYRWQFNLLTGLGAIALLLVFANGLFFAQNREARIALSQRQQFIQQTVPLETLYQEILKALAEMAVRDNDREVLDLLAAQGVNVSVNSPAVAPAAAPARKGGN